MQARRMVSDLAGAPGSFPADVLPDPVVVLSPDGRVVWANPLAVDTFGWGDQDSAVGRQGLDVVHPDDLPTAWASMSSVMNKEQGSPLELRLRDAHGSYRTFEVRGAPAALDGSRDVIAFVLRDLTDRYVWDLTRGDDTVMRRVLDQSPAATLLLTPEGNIRTASRALTRLTGRDLEGVIGSHLTELAVDDDVPVVRAALAWAGPERTRTFEARFRDGGDGVTLRVTVTNVVDDPAVAGLLVTAVDVSDLAEARARLTELAMTDHLTGLPNRSRAEAHLRQLLTEPPSSDKLVSVVFCDVDDFKTVNDEYGHPAGDALLVELATRLRRCVRSTDMVARFAGDEFVVVLEHSQPAELDALVGRIGNALLDPVKLPAGATVQPALSIGSSTAEAPGTPVGALLAAADAAMYKVKHRTRRRQPAPRPT